MSEGLESIFKTILNVLRHVGRLPFKDDSWR